MSKSLVLKNVQSVVWLLRRSVSSAGHSPGGIQRRNLSSVPGSSRYCFESVKQYDYENFLPTLLLKESDRNMVLAIRAFNVEVARVPGIVENDKIRDLRLKFWEDAIEKLYTIDNKKYLPDHPVVHELKVHIDRHKLSKRYWQRLIACRRQRLQFITTKQMEDYAEHSVSSVLYLLLEAAGIKDVKADHAVSHMGKAQGMLNLLRSIHCNRNTQSIPLPQEVLMRHGVSQERILRDSIEDRGVEECIFEIAGIVNQHLEKSNSLFVSMPQEVRPLFMSKIAAQRYLERLRRANFHLTDKSLQSRDIVLPFTYYWCKLRGKY